MGLAEWEGFSRREGVSSMRGESSREMGLAGIKGVVGVWLE